MTVAAGHVVFVTNQLKTLFYIALAQNLQAEGVAVSWIITSQRWSKLIRSGGVADQRILDIWKSGPLWEQGAPPTSSQVKLLTRIELAGRHSVRNMIMMDRELCRLAPAVALAYTAINAEAINQFLTSRAVDVLVGETTWCIETLSAQTAALHGAEYYSPNTLRLPSSRMYFVTDLGPDPFLIWRAPDAEDRKIAAGTAVAQNTGQAKPYYMNSIPSPFTWKSHWAKEIGVALGVSNGNRYDISVPNITIRIVRRIRFAWRSALTRRFVEFHQGPSGPGSAYIFITLHYQPEASVDNWGMPFANQYETIAALARIVPIGTEILVKEHRAAIGCRSLGYYGKLKQLPGVRLIDPAASTPDLMRGADLVASPSGTASLEAAVMGVPAVCFGKVSFGGALLQQGFDPYAMSRADMAEFMKMAATERASRALAQRALEHLALAIANSVEARAGDPVSDPQSVSASNLAAISAGLIQGCAQVRGQRERRPQTALDQKT